MENHLSESTQEILPSAKIDMPANQNDKAVTSSVNRNTMCFKSTVRRLGVSKNKL